MSALHLDAVAMTIEAERQWAVIWRLSEGKKTGGGGVRLGEKQAEKAASVRMSLNSYLSCVCQMALCTLPLHNQNTESHSHTHSPKLNTSNVKHLWSTAFTDKCFIPPPFQTRPHRTCAPASGGHRTWTAYTPLSIKQCLSVWDLCVKIALMCKNRVVKIDRCENANKSCYAWILEPFVSMWRRSCYCVRRYTFLN